MPKTRNAIAYGAIVAVALFFAGTPGSRSATPASAATGPNAPPAVVEAAGIQLRSVGFDFPVDGRAFPPGPNVDLVAANCITCHTPGMILTQPALTKAEWTGEVTKMAKVYKAPIADADMPAIVAYLASMKVGP